jgi:hypothetical protein
MIKTLLRAAALLSLTILVMGSAPDQLKTIGFSCGTPFVDPHELRGIKTVHLDIDGFPAPLEGSQVSEVSLAAQVKRQLLEAGLKSSTEYLADAPTFHIRVLPVQGATQGFFVISAEVEENCRVSRAGGVDVTFCTTWSIYPRLGFFDRGDASIIEAQVADVVKQFVGAWSSDNPLAKK